MIDRKIKLMLLYCCMIRNRNGVIALDANLLVRKIIENGYTIGDISNLLGLSRNVLSKKLHNINRLTVGEARMLKYALDLSDAEAISIFFGA